MNTRLKSAALLIVTLMLGMVLGALVNARLADQRIQQIGELRSAQGFVRMMERTIEPTDAEQAEAVRAVLRAMQEKIRAQNNAHRRAIREVMRSSRAELDALLTDEQIKRLEERRLTWQRERRDGRDGPPHRRQQRRPPPPDSTQN